MNELAALLILLFVCSFFIVPIYAAMQFTPFNPFTILFLMAMFVLFIFATLIMAKARGSI